MSETQVKFTIAKGGKTRMEVIGGQGESCVDLTKELEVNLASAGAESTDNGKKPEFFEADTGLSSFSTIDQ